MTAFTSLLQPATNVQGLLGTFAAKLDDLGSVDRVETLLALHPEAIHLTVRLETGASRGSNEMPLFNQVDETRGWRHVD